MSDEEILAELDPIKDPDSTEWINELLDSGHDKMQWARKSADELLAYADFLEERANSFRGLAYQLAVEARTLAEEAAQLVALEFPTDAEEVEVDAD